jgi:hypothetical protein
MGHYTRASHETCVIATRGSFKVADRATRSVFTAPVGKHSEKPAEFFALVEKLCGAKGDQNETENGGPFVELFARKPRPGWHCFGDELPSGYVWTPKTVGEPAPCTVSPEQFTDFVPPSAPSPHEPSNTWDTVIARAMSHEEDPEPGEPPLPEDCTIGPSAVKARPRGPIPAHVAADLGTHPAVISETQRLAYLALAVDGGIITKDEAANPADAWILLQYRAPAGFFKVEKKKPEGLSQLAQDLGAHGHPVNLIVLAGWSTLRLDILRLWVDQGGKADQAPDFLTEEVARNPAATVPPEHTAKAEARRVRIPEGVPSLVENGASTHIENMSEGLAAVVAATEGAAKPKRGRKAKQAAGEQGVSAAALLSGATGWDAVIARANSHEGEDEVSP